MSAFSANTNRKEIELSGKLIRLISNEGDSFDVPQEYCINVSDHIKNTLEMSADEELPTMDLPTINNATLRTVIQFMEEYAKEPFAPIAKPLPKEGLHTILRTYYRDLLNINMLRAVLPTPLCSLASLPLAAPLWSTFSLLPTFSRSLA